jgi:hypothetical protein
MKAHTIQRNLRGLLALAILAILGSTLLHADEPPVARDRPRIRILDLDGKRNGFKIEVPLDRAEKLRDILNKEVDEQKLAETLNDLAEDAKQKLVIKLVAANVTRFKDELTKKMGKAGVVVTITGPRFRDPDSYPAFDAETRAKIRELLPDQAKGILAMLNTNPKLALVSPWFWSIAPKNE